MAARPCSDAGSCGTRASASSNRLASFEVALRAGIVSTNSPASGTQTSLQTSHSRLQLHAQFGGLVAGRDRHRHRQQHGALVAVVDQGPHFQRLRRRPRDVAGDGAVGELPIQRGGQAGVAGILPVAVPVRLMLQRQRQPQRLAGGDARGRMREQFGAHMLGGQQRRSVQRPATARTTPRRPIAPATTLNTPESLPLHRPAARRKRARRRQLTARRLPLHGQGNAQGLCRQGRR